MAQITLDPNAPEFTRRYANLADPRLGARPLACSDEFFAPLERMLNPAPAVFIPDKYDDHGKWMDGWESRRKRTPGHDWCIVALAKRARVYGVEIDTSHFTGNYPPAASLEGCDSASDPDDKTVWFPVLAKVALNGNSRAYHAVAPDRSITHLRLNIFPDGGIARLRVYGRPDIDWSSLDAGVPYDMAAATNGGAIVATNNQHFGLAANMLLPGRGVNMGDGWETRRRREPGNDWCVIALARPTMIEKIEVDTCHYKGNYPDRCSLRGILADGATVNVDESASWPLLLAEQKLQMDHRHFYEREIEKIGRVSHVRLDIFPDGGVSRLRLWGKIA